MPSKPTAMNRRAFLRSALITTLGTLAAGAGVTLWASQIEPGQLEITRLDLPLPRLPKAFDGLRLLQLSDVHANDWMTPERLAGLMETANGLTPDLVVLTGDTTYGSMSTTKFLDRLNDLTESLSKLTPALGVLAVMGNHEYYKRPSQVRAAFKAAGVDELSNRGAVFTRGSASLWVGGLDDALSKRDRFSVLLQDLPPEGAPLLLAHEPDYAVRYAASGAFDLILSGHTHGGQIVFPIVGPLYLPKGGRKYPAGLYEVENAKLYVSRGAGMIEPFVRLNCPPEIALFTLRSPA